MHRNITPAAKVALADPRKGLYDRGSSRSRRRSCEVRRQMAPASTWCPIADAAGITFLASLPASPHIFKADPDGERFEKYFQIVRLASATRTAADRQPEFHPSVSRVVSSSAGTDCLHQRSKRSSKRAFDAAGFQIRRPFRSITYARSITPTAAQRVRLPAVFIGFEQLLYGTDFRSAMPVVAFLFPKTSALVAART